MKRLYTFFTLTILALALSIVATAQRTNDVLYLKNGTIIRGTIVEFNPQTGIRIAIPGNYELFFPNSEIEIVKNEKTIKSKPSLAVPDTSSWIFKPVSGLMVGAGGNEHEAPFSFLTTVMYRFHPKLQAGVGSGVEFFNETTLPLFSEINYFLYNKPVSPYIFAMGGYALALENRNQSAYNNPIDSKGGELYGAGLGLKFALRNGSSLIIQTGYRLQMLRYDAKSYYYNYPLYSSFWPGPGSETVTERRDELKRFSFQIGITF